MEQTTKKSQYILWIAALLAVFVVIALAGTKVFYGIIVPQVQAINQLGIVIILGFSFVAGLAAFFAPCPFAVFPAYIAYYLNIETGEALYRKRPLHALKIGSIVSLGIFSFYGILGLAMSLFGVILASYTYYLKLAIIPVFFILGWMLIAGKSIKNTIFDIYPPVIVSDEKYDPSRHQFANSNMPPISITIQQKSNRASQLFTEKQRLGIDVVRIQAELDKVNEFLRTGRNQEAERLLDDIIKELENL